MILKVKVGAGFRGLDSYVSAKTTAVLVSTNMGGTTPSERAREVAGLRSARPDLKKAVGHLILSHDPTLPDLSIDQWRVAIDIARAEHDLQDAPFTSVLHNDSDHRHVHLAFLRIRPDGSVVSDSHSYRKNEAAARHIECALRLPSPREVPVENRLGDRQRVENAMRRARRKSEQRSETLMEVAELRRRISAALAVSSAVDTFDRELAYLGVEVEWSPNRVGVKFRPTGASTWLKGSSITRNLSAANLLRTMNRNAHTGNTQASMGGKAPVDSSAGGNLDELEALVIADVSPGAEFDPETDDCAVPEAAEQLQVEHGCMVEASGVNDVDEGDALLQSSRVRARQG